MNQIKNQISGTVIELTKKLKTHTVVLTQN